MVAGSLPAESEARKCDIVPVVPGISWHLMRGATSSFMYDYHLRLAGKMTEEHAPNMVHSHYKI